MGKKNRRNNRGRHVDGIIVVDKVYGASSNEVLQRVKRLFNATKAGHTGSLDPLATGVLPICLGEATKFSQYLLNSDKSYRTTMKMGARTTTGDRDGEVVDTRPVTVTKSDVETILQQFSGDVEQIPSMYSAIKHKGKPLYEYARAGINIERPLRTITIHRLELLSFEGDECVFDVDCTKGTYIRTLTEDIGNALGCLGHVAELKRLKAGPFTEHHALSLDDLLTLRNTARNSALDDKERVEFSQLSDLSKSLGYDGLDSTQLERLRKLSRIRNNAGDRVIDRKLLPQDSAVKDFPEVKLGKTSSYYISKGNPVQVSQAPTSGHVRIYGFSEGIEEIVFMGIGEISEDGLVAPKRLVNRL